MSNDNTGEISRSNGGSRFPITSLPEITTAHVIQEYRRFVNNGGAVGAALTIFGCLNQFMFSVTPLLLYNYIRAFRIKKIRILSPITTQGTSITCSIQPIGIDSGNNNFNAVPEKYLDTSASIDVPAYISLTPDRTTPLGSWHYNVSVDGSLAQIVCPAGSTMDILFEYIMTTESTSSSYTRVVAGATVGLLYTANMISNFVPQGRPVI